MNESMNTEMKVPAPSTEIDDSVEGHVNFRPLDRGGHDGEKHLEDAESGDMKRG